MSSISPNSLLTSDDPHCLLRERELAARWHKSLRTLQRWRNAGYGPTYLQIGGSVHYRLADVLAFEAMQRRGGSA